MFENLFFLTLLLLRGLREVLFGLLREDFFDSWIFFSGLPTAIFSSLS
jgi:hypothetical protein